MQIQIKYLLILFLLQFSAEIKAQKTSDIRAVTEEIVYKKTPINFDRTPGFIIGIIDGDSTYIQSFGTLKKDTIIAPEEQTIFEIGSLTNIFTARLVNILAAKGLLKKDVSINEFLPDSLQNSGAEQVTLHRLLSHTSGLPRIPIGIGKTQKVDNQPFAGYSKDMLRAYYRSFNFETAEVGTYNFSHLGYAIIELIIEHQSQLPYDRALREYLFKDKYPNTGILVPQEKISQGFDKAHSPTPPWSHPSFAAATGLKSTMTDLLQLLSDNLNTETYDAQQKALLPTEMREGVFVGEGWHIIQPKKYHPIIVHTGATSGHRGYIAFVKETGTGVVVLSNSEYALRGLGYRLLEELNGGKFKF